METMAFNNASIDEINSYKEKKKLKMEAGKPVSSCRSL